MKKKDTFKNQYLPELSALLETKPHLHLEADTEQLEPSKLNRARRVARNTIRSSQNHFLRRWNIYLIIILILLIWTGFNWFFTKNSFTSKNKFLFENISELSSEDKERFQKVNDQPLEIHGPLMVFALSQGNIGKPVIYIATNLPDGIPINFTLKGRAGDILSDHTVHIKIPLTVTQHLIKTPSLHMKDDLPLPPGIYEASVTIDDGPEHEQTQNSKYWSKQKTYYHQSFSLGQPNSSALTIQLKKQREMMKSQGKKEYIQLLHLFKSIQGMTYSLLKSTHNYQITKNISKGKKNWTHFHKSWQPRRLGNISSGHFFKNYFHSLYTLSHEVLSLESFANQHINQHIKTSKTIQPFTIQLQKQSLKVSEKMKLIETQIDALGKTINNPNYLPSVDSFE